MYVLDTKEAREKWKIGSADPKSSDLFFSPCAVSDLAILMLLKRWNSGSQCNLRACAIDVSALGQETLGEMSDPGR